MYYSRWMFLSYVAFLENNTHFHNVNDSRGKQVIVHASLFCCILVRKFLTVTTRLKWLFLARVLTWGALVQNILATTHLPRPNSQVLLNDGQGCRAQLTLSWNLLWKVFRQGVIILMRWYDFFVNVDKNSVKQMRCGRSTDTSMLIKLKIFGLIFNVRLWGDGERNLSTSGGGSVKQE